MPIAKDVQILLNNIELITPNEERRYDLFLGSVGFLRISVCATRTARLSKSNNFGRFGLHYQNPAISKHFMKCLIETEKFIEKFKSIPLNIEKRVIPKIDFIILFIIF